MVRSFYFLHRRTLFRRQAVQRMDLLIYICFPLAGVGVVSLFFSRVSLRKSHSTWSPCQNSSDRLKNAPKRMDIAGVIERLAWTILLITRGATPMARAMASCEIPIGLRYSSSRISPGVIGLSMSISSGITVLWACPVVAVPLPIAARLLGWCAYRSAQCGPFPSQVFADARPRGDQCLW